jgi:hypothetical protein
MKRGICGLCKADTGLHDSHLLPSALYKFMREPSLQNPNPIRVNPSIAVATSHEVRQFFLCSSCEDRFNKGGERWMLRNCAQPDSSFPLHGKVIPLPGIGSEVKLYATNGDPEIDATQIEYFAASVLWRAAATDWRNHNTRLEMGPYEERFRRYLLNEEPFPQNAALRIFLASPTAAKLLALLPMPHRVNGMRCFTFLIPGIAFTFILANHIPEELKRLVFSPSLERMIAISDEMYGAWIKALGKKLQSVEPKGYLKEFWNGPNPRHG